MFEVKDDVEVAEMKIEKLTCDTSGNIGVFLSHPIKKRGKR